MKNWNLSASSSDSSRRDDFCEAPVSPAFIDSSTVMTISMSSLGTETAKKTHTASEANLESGGISDGSSIGTITFLSGLNAKATCKLSCSSFDCSH